MNTHEEVKQRIKWLKQELAAHDSSIVLLQAFSTGKISLKGKGYTWRAESYQPTLEDKKRLPRTLANLNQQRVVLLFEINHLKGEDGV